MVDLNVPVQLAQRVDVGTQVWVKRESQILQAVVATKSPELTASSRTQPLTLNITSPADSGSPAAETPSWNFGQVVEVQFLLESDRDGYWLPYSALQRAGGGLWSAFVLEGDGEQQILARRIVEIVQLDNTHALVRGALSAGDLFVADGLNRVVPGQTVRANEVASSSPAEKLAGAAQ